MSDQLRLQIDLDRVAANLSASRGRAVTRHGAEKWLVDNGFEPSEGSWIADMSVASLLNDGEVVSAASLDDPEGKSTPAVQADWVYEAPPSYVLTPQRREMLRSIPEYDQCVVPSFICGTRRNAMDKWRRVGKKVLRAAGFAKGLKGGEFVHIDDAPGGIVCADYYSIFPQTVGVMVASILGKLTEQVYDMGRDRHLWYCVQRQLLLDGLNSFWFSLCFVATANFFFPTVMSPGYEEDRALVAKLALPKLMRWWPHFCTRNDRFCHLDGDLRPWPAWGSGAITLVPSQEGAARLRTTTAEEAGDHLRTLIDPTAKDV